MPHLTNYLAGKIAAQHFHGKFYLGAFISPPTPIANTGVEVNVGAYKRVPVAIDADHEKATNSGEVIFAVADAPWGDVVAVGVFDAPTGGNLLWFTPLEAPEAIGINHQLRIDHGFLQLLLNR